jgi:uncharacterized RDD family membrane protein YckC
VLHTLAGQTIGKSLVAIRVVDVDGAPLTLGASLLRYLSYFLSLMPLGFGYLVAALRRDKRALHDLIAGSRVERAARPRRIVRRAAPSRAPVPAALAAAARPAAVEPEP